MANGKVHTGGRVLVRPGLVEFLIKRSEARGRAPAWLMMLITSEASRKINTVSAQSGSLNGGSRIFVFFCLAVPHEQLKDLKDYRVTSVLGSSREAHRPDIDAELLLGSAHVHRRHVHEWELCGLLGAIFEHRLTPLTAGLLRNENTERKQTKDVGNNY